MFANSLNFKLLIIKIFALMILLSLSGCVSFSKPSPPAKRWTDQTNGQPFQIAPVDELKRTQMPRVAVIQSEVPAVKKSIETLKSQGNQLLICRYFGELGTNQRTVYSYYWYKNVGMSQHDLVFISIGHPLVELGDEPRTSCPETRAEAVTIARSVTDSYEEEVRNYQAYLRKLPAEQGTPKAIGENSCIVFTDNFTIANKCKFPVNIRYCYAYNREGNYCVPGTDYSLPSHQSKYFIPFEGIGRYPDRMHFVACPSPYFPRYPKRLDVRAEGGIPWSCSKKF